MAWLRGASLARSNVRAATVCAKDCGTFPDTVQSRHPKRMSRGLSPAGVGDIRHALQLSSPFAAFARGLQIFCNFLAGSRTGAVVSQRPLLCHAPRSAVVQSTFHRVKTTCLMLGRRCRHCHSPSHFRARAKPLHHRSRRRVLAEQQHRGSLRRQQRVQRQDLGERLLYLR